MMEQDNRSAIVATLRYEAERKGSVAHAAAADELERLWEIVDKLPKCWGLTDGKLVQNVPVVPGMTIWSWWSDGEDPAEIYEDIVQHVETSPKCEAETDPLVICAVGDAPLSECFSTREAAEAAKGGR